MKAEERLLVDMCKFPEDIQIEDYRGIDWNNFLQQSVLHGVMGIVSSYLKRRFDIPFYVALLASDYYAFQKQAVYQKLLEYYRVIEMLNSAGIEFVVLKGVWLSVDIYCDFAHRDFTDLDILVNEKQIFKVKHMLQECGYTQGREYDENEGMFIEAPLDEKAKHTNTLQHEFEFKKRDQHTGLEFSVEIHNRLSTVMDVADFHIGEMLSRRILYSGILGSAYRLDNEDVLIQLCYHNYWHTHTLQSALFCVDIILKLYTDIRLLIKEKEINWSTVWSRANSMKVVFPVQYSLYFCQCIFGDVLDDDVLAKLDKERVIEESVTIRDRWMTGSEEKIGEYTTSFEERMFDPNRIMQALKIVDINKYHNPSTAEYLEKFIPLRDTMK